MTEFLQPRHAEVLFGWVSVLACGGGEMTRVCDLPPDWSQNEVTAFLEDCWGLLMCVSVGLHRGDFAAELHVVPAAGAILYYDSNATVGDCLQLARNVAWRNPDTLGTNLARRMIDTLGSSLCVCAGQDPVASGPQPICGQEIYACFGSPPPRAVRTVPTTR